jgi:inhibitor of the pro-sigma K processing machinery
MGAPMNIFRYIGNFAVKVIIFSVLIYGINIIGASNGLHIPINYFTAIFTGVLGTPALLVLIAIDIFLV